MSIKKPWLEYEDQTSVEQLQRHLNKQSLLPASEWTVFADNYVWGYVTEKQAMLIEKIMQSNAAFADVVLDHSLKRDEACAMQMEEIKKSYNFTEEKWSELVQQYIDGSISFRNFGIIENRRNFDDAFGEQIEQERLLHQAKQILANPESRSISNIQSQGPLHGKSQNFQKGGQ